VAGTVEGERPGTTGQVQKEASLPGCMHWRPKGDNFVHFGQFPSPASRFFALTRRSFLSSATLPSRSLFPVFVSQSLAPSFSPFSLVFPPSLFPAAHPLSHNPPGSFRPVALHSLALAASEYRTAPPSHGHRHHTPHCRFYTLSRLLPPALPACMDRASSPTASTRA
jgi:hypothetical protein